MRPRVVLLCALLVVVGGVFASAGREAAGQVTTAAGIKDVKVESLGHGPSAAAPGQTLILSRLTFAPGGMIDMHTHPGDAVFYVESGQITWVTGMGAPLFTSAAAAAANAAGTPTPPETLTPGQETVLEAGDSVFYTGHDSHEVRNDGTADAVVLYSALRASDEPGITFIE